MKRFVYADNAATTKLDNEAFEAMRAFLQGDFGNPSAIYSFSKVPRQAIRKARETIAACIGALPSEIYFTSGGTESDNWALKGTAFSSPEHAEIITSSFEHHAVLYSCTALNRLGYPISYIKPSTDGVVCVEDLRNAITDRTVLVSIMYANNELGTVQPIQELCSIAHDKGVLFHTDAVQAVGHVPIDVKALGIDMLSASAHKFNGPKGVGFLYIRDGVKILPFLNGGAQEDKMRAGTENVAAIVGMAVALQKNCHCMQQNITHVRSLEKMLLCELKHAGIKFQRNGSGNMLPGVINLSFDTGEGEAILHRLDLMGVCVSTGSACDSQRTQISHVLRAIDLDTEKALRTIRISLGKDNSEEDIQQIVRALTKILS